MSWKDLVLLDAPGRGRAWGAGSAAAGPGPAGGAAAAGRSDSFPPAPLLSLASSALLSSPLQPPRSSPSSSLALLFSILSPHLLSSHGAPLLSQPCSPHPALLSLPSSSHPPRSSLLSRLLSSSTDHAPLRRPLAASAWCGPELRSVAENRALDHVETPSPVVPLECTHSSCCAQTFFFRIRFPFRT